MSFLARNPDSSVRELVERLGLDRRRSYGWYGDTLVANVWVTGECSGCACDCGGGYPCSHGSAGCHECGHTGKRRLPTPDPIICDGDYVKRALVEQAAYRAARGKQ